MRESFAIILHETYGMGTKNITVAYRRYMIMGNHDYITIEIIKINIGT